ncbi:class I SAM-dependent methyltransferase [Pseudaminobacter sp. NGMCC 1.201702]|uniref:class I SAM-dependent methyltransferase n=1 Tax=Pseudaminobacter sp. NGMCC 1.201702 TaxID=3391825 RepID=UPI0039F12055
METQLDHGGLMDRVYRHQRHVYDATRRYYLLGRDPMIAALTPPDGGSVLEIGCGTGRNLVKAAKLFPQATFYGVDISQEMLATAGKSVAAAGLQRQIRLAYADASRFDPMKVFGHCTFDRIFISYAVSMIPGWQAVMRNAVTHLAPGGELHIVDFGDQRELPNWFKTALYTWLGWYHVTPRTNLFEISAEIARSLDAVTETKRLYRGFAWISIIRRPSGGGH